MTDSTNDSAPSEVFELNKNPVAPKQSSLGSFLRVALYGVAALLLVGIVAVQVNPEFSRYVAVIPGISQLTACSQSECHLTGSSCCSATSRCEMSAASCPSTCEAESTFAARPPAPPMAQALETVEL